jgi:hypothetical protein
MRAVPSTSDHKHDLEGYGSVCISSAAYVAWPVDGSPELFSYLRTHARDNKLISCLTDRHTLWPVFHPVSQECPGSVSLLEGSLTRHTITASKVFEPNQLPGVSFSVQRV